MKYEKVLKSRLCFKKKKNAGLFKDTVLWAPLVLLMKFLIVTENGFNWNQYNTESSLSDTARPQHQRKCDRYITRPFFFRDRNPLYKCNVAPVSARFREHVNRRRWKFSLSAHLTNGARTTYRGPHCFGLLLIRIEVMTFPTHPRFCHGCLPTLNALSCTCITCQQIMIPGITTH